MSPAATAARGSDLAQGRGPGDQVAALLANAATLETLIAIGDGATDAFLFAMRPRRRQAAR